MTAADRRIAAGHLFAQGLNARDIAAILGVIDWLVWDDRANAKDNGRYAYHAGRGLDDNPYPYRSEQWRAWRAGLMQAFDEER